ncbi:MAG: tyrosine-type recombinase/integrase [Luteolibacter sp.]|uniref:tyrosine-type recombinase/integrase n=1 Tax=Luteolibacter sp. TaxID=1962973 RepID=UPI0032638739
MASLRKRKDSAVWWGQYYVLDKDTQALKQIRKSTGQTNKKLAMIAAVEMERAAQGVMAAGSDKAQRAKAILAQAVADIEKEKFTTLSARKCLAELLEIATGEAMAFYSVATWFEEWLRRKSRDSSEGTIKRYKKSLDVFAAWLGDERKLKPLESVTMADIRSWRELLQDEGRAGKTVNKYVKDVGSAFRAAIRDGLVNFNPCGALEAVSTEDSMDRKPFIMAQVVALLGASPSVEWRGLILVAAFTGLRMTDAARLRWDSVDMQASMISLIPSKTKRKKREVRIPIQSDLLEFLQERSKSRDPQEPFVLPALSKKKANGRTGLSGAFVEIMAKAKVDRGKASRASAESDGKIAGRTVYELGFHSLRHTFTSWLRTAGVSEEDRMALTGHSTRESHAIYSHTDAEVLRTAIKKLPTLEKTPC